MPRHCIKSNAPFPAIQVLKVEAGSGEATFIAGSKPTTPPTGAAKSKTPPSSGRPGSPPKSPTGKPSTPKGKGGAAAPGVPEEEVKPEVTPPVQVWAGAGLFGLFYALSIVLRSKWFLGTVYI